MGRGRGPGKFLNFNQVAFERVLAFVERKRKVNAKVEGEGMGSGA